jgi:hydrogenase-4 component F
MRLVLVCVLPLLAAAASLAVPTHRTASLYVGMLVAAAAAHLGIVVTLWLWPAPPIFQGWLGADALGLLVLTLTTTLFFLTAIYSVGYLGRERRGPVGVERRRRKRNDRVFVAGLLCFLSAATIVALSQNLALLWVGMEAATLSLAPLVFHRHDRRSLEAVWKYLVISSVGIALALLGVFFMATAQSGVAGRPLILTDLVSTAPELDVAWLRAAFIFLLVGFGTKMGLAPMHTWKPDTYGEAPSPVSGLMAGALTSCAFLGVARATEVVLMAGLGPFAQPLLIAFGLLSLAVAAAFIVLQTDVKRLLAYSSVEHMGLLVLGLGLGGMGAFGSVLHMINNGLSESWLFLVAGNVVLASGTSVGSENRGLVRTLPVSGLLLALGLFAATGSPPFGLFVSEFTILRAAIAAGHPLIAAAMLILLAIIFVGMAVLILDMVLGQPTRQSGPVRESRWLVIGPAVLAATVLMLGVYIPSPLRAALERAALALGGASP